MIDHNIIKQILRESNKNTKISDDNRIYYNGVYVGTIDIENLTLNYMHIKNN